MMVLLNIGDKIYYIDYEESSSSYTIENIYEVKDNPVMKDGWYYTIHSDLLSVATGYYPLYVDEVDADGSRFFSSEKFAHDAFVKFKEVNK